MELGGVILGSGMILKISPGDYLYGDHTIVFMVERILEVRTHEGHSWALLKGLERPGVNNPWRSCRVEVRVSALKRSLTFGVI